MKVYAISDLHLSINNPKPMNIFGKVWENYLGDIEESLEYVGPQDLVLLAGDHSWAMTLDAAVPDLKYIGGFPGKKVLIRGNHDYWWKGISAVRAVLPENVFAVQNDCIAFDDVLVCGSRGWSVDDRTEEGKKLVARELIRAEMSLKCMQNMKKPEHKVIFMIHYPPFNARFEDSAFTELFKSYGVNAVVYGHLHGRDCRSKPFIEKDGIGYYLTSCDQINNRATEIKL